MDDDGPVGDLAQLLTTLRNSRGPARIRSAARGALPRAAGRAPLADKLEVVDLTVSPGQAHCSHTHESLSLALATGRLVPHPGVLGCSAADSNDGCL